MDYYRIVERATRTFQLKLELGACLNELSERDGFWLTPEGKKASVEPVDQADPASSVQSYECLVKALGRERRHGWRKNPLHKLWSTSHGRDKCI